MSKGEDIGSYPDDIPKAVVEISIGGPLPSEVVGESPGVGEGGQQRAFEVLKTIDVTKGEESDGQYYEEEEEEQQMEGHGLKVMSCFFGLFFFSFFSLSRLSK